MTAQVFGVHVLHYSNVDRYVLHVSLQLQGIYIMIAQRYKLSYWTSF